jgi:hypothetical protein
MRLVATIVAALMSLGVAVLGLILAQKGSTLKGGTPTATVASAVYIAEAQEVSALPTRAPASQIAQATGSEASPLILQANVDPQSGSPITTGHARSVGGSGSSQCQRADPEHYFQGYGP